MSWPDGPKIIAIIAYTLLAVLPDNEENAKSMKEIALALDLDISSHAS